MIFVHAPCRLHFGLMNISALQPWLNVDGEPTIPSRCFGGVGMMIEEPAIDVRVQPSGEWSAAGPMAEKALAFARQFAATTRELAPHEIKVTTQVTPHAGLGTGTQLALAVAKALAMSCGHSEWNSVELARRVGRGLRSAVGIHGFDHGGFIVEGGKRGELEIAPLVARFDVPCEWRVVLVIPRCPAGYSGESEQIAFDQLRDRAIPNQPDPLCRLVLLGMLPALVERDCKGFGEAVYDYNARVGENFAPVQKTRYSSSVVKEMVKFCRRNGIRGVGQSSWGPSVFAIVPDEAGANQLRAELAHAYQNEIEHIAIARPRNCGALVSDMSGSFAG
jgi:beta-ribofuranosylaminobenzene 5'-phosphate synthase